jgi:two-component system NtrC family sensor kinase
MGSRLSLRLQIVVILVLMLGAEALLSSTWLALVLHRTLASEHKQLVVEALTPLMAAAVRDCDDLACAEHRLRPALDGLGMHDAELTEEAQPSRRAVGGGLPIRISSGPLRLTGQLPAGTGAAAAAQLVQFHIANLAAVVLAIAVLGSALFNRAVARPVERLAEVADRIGHLELPELSSGLEMNAPMLGQLTASFQRMARALGREKERVGVQIAELTRINRELRDARESVIRQEKLATVGRLAAGVAHEVGNPLGGILGYAELLKAKGDATAQEYAVRIEREVARIDQTVRGLLDYARPSDAALAPISLASSIERALSLCQADKRFREVTVQQALPGTLPRVLADEHRLGQVLVNLLLNAGDAMDGKGQVTLAAEGVDDPRGRRVRLIVDDTGPGIAADVLPRLFDPFFTTKEVGKGTGLGLSISASIVDAFGGTLHAENLPGGGARFVVALRAES